MHILSSGLASIKLTKLLITRKGTNRQIRPTKQKQPPFQQHSTLKQEKAFSMKFHEKCSTTGLCHVSKHRLTQTNNLHRFENIG